MPRRTFEQVQAEEIAHEAVQGRLKAIRNSWYFANIYQFICMFGDSLKIDSELDIDVFEQECLKPEPSQKLAEIGLCLLKWISSHRGLTLEIFEEYTRRQYLAKAPALNPFGDHEEPIKFRDMDLFTKLRVLHQLSVWIFWNPDRIREKVGESDHTQWRVDPFGNDAKGRAYYVLDDNRLYRMSYPDALPPAAKKAKATSKKASAARRSSKRQKASNGVAWSEDGDALDDNNEENEPDESLGGARWECIAVTLEEYQSFLETIKKSKNSDEQDVYETLQENVLPELERAAESKKRKHTQRMRELENMQRLATAKRSSRLAGKAEKQRAEEEQIAAEEKFRRDIDMAHAEQDRQQRMDLARESRMQTREQRLKDREVRRILHQEELDKLERGESVDSDGVRISERYRKSQLEQKQRDLKALDQEKAEDEWYFDCSGCGAVGKNFEDSKDAIACEKCGVWQHSACHGIKPEEAARDDYQFVCHHCVTYPRGIKISVPQKALKSAGSSTASTSKQRNTPVNATEQPKKRKPGRPRKQPLEDAPSNIDSLSANSNSAGSQAKSNSLVAIAPNGHAAGVHRPPVSSGHEKPSIHHPYPGTQPVWQASTRYPQYSSQPHQPSALAPQPLSNGDPVAYHIPHQPHGPYSSGSAPFLPNQPAQNNQTAIAAQTNPGYVDSSPQSPPGVELSQTPRPKYPTTSAQSPIQGTGHPSGNAINTPSSFEQKVVAPSNLATPSHPNPATAPSSTASTRFLPSPHAVSNAVASGKSPVKHDVAGLASSFESGASQAEQGPTETRGGQAAETPAKVAAPAMPPAPVLSPSVNAGSIKTQVPVKKASPEQHASEQGVLLPPVPHSAPFTTVQGTASPLAAPAKDAQVNAIDSARTTEGQAREE